MGKARIVEKIRIESGGIRKVVTNLLQEGYINLITITGVDQGDNIKLLYHFSNPKGDIKHIETLISKNSLSIPTISDIILGSYIYEMEVHDLLGVDFVYNPWAEFKLLLPECYPPDFPPPLWKEADPKVIREKLFAVEGPGCTILEPVSPMSALSPESVIVPFGPYHPALKEPEYFRLIVEGETIVAAVPRIGFIHRGIEKATEYRTFLKDIFLLERVCGICSLHHSWTFVMAVEELLGLEVPERAEYIRTLIAELERIHSHSLWLGLVGYWMGFETMFMWVWSVREEIMDLFEILCGNRVHKSIVTIGGVRRDISDEKLKIVLEKLQKFEKHFKSVMEDVLSYDEFIERTSGIGTYSLETARKLCTVGAIRRAVGDPYDIRKIEPYGAYSEVDFKVVTRNKGDVYNLVLVRMEEVLESIHIIRQLIENMPSGNPVPKRLFMGIVPKGEAYARTEAPRGELFYYVLSENKHNPSRVKIRTPTLANITLASEALKGATLSDVPLVIVSIDPCFSCMDRMVIYRRDKGEVEVVSEKYFHRRRRKWIRK